MIHFKSYFKEYDWIIDVYIILKSKNIEQIITDLQKLKGSEDTINQAVSRIMYYENSGFTYTNSLQHHSIMVINSPISLAEFIDTYNHEKNHIEIHICNEYNIDPYSEQAAYLSGLLSKTLFNTLIKNEINKY